MTETDYYLGFAVFHGIGPKRFQDLLTRFGSAKNAWKGHDSDIIQVLGKAYGSSFLRFRDTFSLPDYKKRLQEKQVWFVASEENLYPRSLCEISNPPIVLFGKGDTSVLTESGPKIGVVGTRKISGYGRQVTEMITRELVDAGCIIVSGLALGVDAVAHTITLELAGKTIAVLGSGVDVCHPASNRRIYENIISTKGAVVSEYSLGEPPSRGSFPSRNRIIAGLSSGVVVTEGAEDSGALITAEDALRLGRTVYAVPGPITSSLSKGPNSLLAKGAKLLTSGKDIVGDFGGEHRAKSIEHREIKGETEEEQKIIDLLRNESLLFDEIVKQTGFDSSKTGMLLSLMELKGMLRSADTGVYSLVLDSMNIM